MSATSLAGAERSPAEMVEPRRRRRPILPLVYWIVTGVTLVPIAFMVVYSFNDVPTGRISFHWSGFTPYWYLNLGQVSGLTEAFLTSIEIAVLSAAVSIVLGVPLALALERYRFLARGPLNATVYADIAAPSIVVGAASLSFFLSADISTGFVTILLVHVAFNLAYVVVVLRAAAVGRRHGVRRGRRRPRGIAARGVLHRHAAAAAARHHRGRHAVAGHVDRRLRDHELRRRAVRHLPAVRLRRRQGRAPPQVLCFGTIIFAVGLLVALVNALITRRVPRAAVDDE